MNFFGKKLLIIGGAFQHCKLVEAAKKMGVITYVVDYLPVEKAPAKQIADFHYEYNITDYDEIVALCREEKIDGVLSSHLDACQIPYQVICERLGLPCFGTKEQYHILTDKTAFLNCCLENGVDIVPQYKESDFATPNGAVEYPVFVKPCDSRGSRGQTVCYSYEEVGDAIRFAKGESKSGKVILEKYMGDKQEFTMSYLFADGNPILVRTGDRYVGTREDRMDKSSVLSVSPSRYTDLYLKNEHEKVVRMLKKIGIKNGPVFMQGFVDGEVVRFFDPGLRFPGCEYDRMFTKATGIDVCSALIAFSLTGAFPSGLLKEVTPARLNGKIVNMLFIVVKPGRIRSIEGLDKISKDSAVTAVAQRYFEGDEIGAFYNVNQRFCEIDFICNSIEETKKKIAWIYDTLKITEENGSDMKIAYFQAERLKEMP